MRLNFIYEVDFFAFMNVEYTTELLKRPFIELFALSLQLDIKNISNGVKNDWISSESDIQKKLCQTWSC